MYSKNLNVPGVSGKEKSTKPEHTETTKDFPREQNWEWDTAQND